MHHADWTLPNARLGANARARTRKACRSCELSWAIGTRGAAWGLEAGAARLESNEPAMWVCFVEGVSGFCCGRSKRQTAHFGISPFLTGRSVGLGNLHEQVGCKMWATYGVPLIPLVECQILTFPMLHTHKYILICICASQLTSHFSAALAFPKQIGKRL